MAGSLFKDSVFSKLIKLNVFPLTLTSLFLCFVLEINFSWLAPLPVLLLPKSSRISLLCFSSEMLISLNWACLVLVSLVTFNPA